MFSFQVCAALRAKGRADLVASLDDEGLQDLANFLQPLEKNGDVPAGGLEKLCRLLEPDDEDHP